MKENMQKIVVDIPQNVFDRLKRTEKEEGIPIPDQIRTHLTNETLVYSAKKARRGRRAIRPNKVPGIK